MNYYTHHIGDYLKDTSHLSALEDGMYRRMLDLYYISEKPLPLNIDGLYRLVRAKTREEKKAVDTLLEEFFVRCDTGFRQSRCDREILFAQEKSGKAKASANKRWHCDGNALAMPSHCDGNAPNTQYPTTNTQQPTTPARRGSPVSVDKEEPMILPEWLPLEQWKAWLDVRKKIKAPNTPRALKLALAELERLKSQGYAPAAVLDQATVKGWKFPYPLKEGLPATEPAGKLCDYCTKVSEGNVSGRRACSEHWRLAMDGISPLKAIEDAMDMKPRRMLGVVAKNVTGER